MIVAVPPETANLLVFPRSDQVSAQKSLTMKHFLKTLEIGIYTLMYTTRWSLLSVGVKNARSGGAETLMNTSCIVDNVQMSIS